ncbi:MAG: YdeI/OmpD-associated family protein [Verrucomicrobiota bacterium]
MSKKDPRVEAYIAKSPGFAKPILLRIRKLVHAACPDVTETIKWNSPFYERKGILVCTPAFKQHCALIFWKGKLIFGKGDQRKKFRRITALADLPGDKILTGYIKQAVALNEAGVKTSRPKPKARQKAAVPDYFLAALKKNQKALATFENLSPSCQEEYVEWLTEARRAETRIKRLPTAIQWLAAGKSRNWKYH